MKFKSYPKYKNSGVEWLGEVPIGWDIKKVKYLFEIRKRIAGKEGYPVLSITQRGIKVKDTISGEGQLSMDYSKYQFVEFGDFAMNHMDLLTGYVDISNFHGVTSPDYRVFALTDTNSVDRYFLYLMQMGYKNKIFFSYGQGIANIGRWRLQTDSFNNFSVPYPNKKEQQIIANFLDHETRRIDDLIEEKNRFIELLKEKRQALISHAVTKGLDPTVKMKNSGVEWLEEIPEHWKIITLRYLVSTTKGFAFKSIDYCDSGVLIVRASDIKNKTILESKIYLPYSFTKLYKNVVLEEGDIIVSTVGSTPEVINSAVGQIGQVPKLLGGALLNQNTVKFHPKKMVHYDYLKFLLLASSYRDHLNLHAHGTANQASLNIEDMLNYKTVVPSFSEQQKIVMYLSKETDKIDALIQETQVSIELLKEHRTALISAAVTGKIDVREAA